MFIVILRFGDHKQDAPKYMNDHNQWISDGFESGAFQLVGSIVPPGGGVLLVRGTRDEVEARVAQDPFVAHGVVTAEIVEVNVGRHSPGLECLL